MTPVAHLFLQLLIIIGLSRMVGKAFTLIGLPGVVGEMTTGVLLGPSLFGIVAPEAFAFVFPMNSLEPLRLLAQVGICLFMFAVGMDLDLQQVRHSARTAIVVSQTSIVVPFLLGVGLAWFLVGNYAGPKATFLGFALFMGISMSITAFPVLVRILQDRQLSRTPLGVLAITCAAINDVAAWAIMAFVVAIARASSMGGAVLTLVLALVFIAVMIWVVRPLVPRWLGEDRLSRELPTSGTLATVVCVAIAGALCTELIGIHALFGAFLAGAIMPTTEGFRDRINTYVERFSTVLLLPLFFAYTGLRTQVGLLDDLQGWAWCLLIILVATAGKLGAAAVAARLAGMAWRDSLALGALMNTRGLIELIALNIGYDIGILSPRVFTMLVIMALVTTLLTGPLLTLLGARSGQSAPHPAQS